MTWKVVNADGKYVYATPCDEEALRNATMENNPATLVMKDTRWQAARSDFTAVATRPIAAGQLVTSADIRGDVYPAMKWSDALDEARRRWGIAGTAATQRGLCCVGAGLEGTWRGMGATWEEAFAHADGAERASGQATTASSARPSPMTGKDADSEAVRRWGPTAGAYVDCHECVVGAFGGFWHSGTTFEEAFAKADRSASTPEPKPESRGLAASMFPRRSERPVIPADSRGDAHVDIEDAYRFGVVPIGPDGQVIPRSVRRPSRPTPPTPTDIRAENRRTAATIIAACPPWAYPTAWSIAVMAHVEEYNNCDTPRRHEPPKVLELVLGVYHRARLRGLTVASAVAEAHATSGAAWVERICHAYERGRPGPGGVSSGLAIRGQCTGRGRR
jgi:hypothetical protein